MPDINVGRMCFGLALIDFGAGATLVVAQTAIIISTKTKVYVFASKSDSARI
jgi:hypothetical protein